MKMNMSSERYEEEWWDGEYAGPIEREDEREDIPRGKSKANRRRLQQMELELEYNLDEI